MNLIPIIFLVLGAVAEEEEAENMTLFRNLLDFYSMIKTLTNRNPLDYNGYGNWCGRGGSGPVQDDIDKCCFNHDNCYGRANKGYCKDIPFHVGTYVLPYRWAFHKGRIFCVGADKRCEFAICRCDKKAAECFKSYEYKAEYKKKLYVGSLI